MHTTLFDGYATASPFIFSQPASLSLPLMTKAEQG